MGNRLTFTPILVVSMICYKVDIPKFQRFHSCLL